MASVVAGSWFNKVTGDITEGFKDIKKDLTKTSSKESGPSVKSSELRKGAHIYYGFSLFLIEGLQSQKWGIVKEKESLFSKDLTNYTKAVSDKARPFCFVGARPAHMARTKVDKKDLVVRYGDKVILWAQLGMGRYGRTTALRGYLIFDLTKPEIGEGLQGSSCFRILTAESQANNEPVKYDCVFRLESCKSPGCFLSCDGEYVKANGKAESDQCAFRFHRYTEKAKAKEILPLAMAIAGTDEEVAWYAKLQEGVKSMMEDDKNGDERA